MIFFSRQRRLLQRNILKIYTVWVISDLRIIFSIAFTRIPLFEMVLQQFSLWCNIYNLI